MGRKRKRSTLSQPQMEPLTDLDTPDSILPHLRHEITSAQARDSDLDFAYRLQLQEVITASLSDHHPPPPDDLVFIPDDVVDFDYTALLLQDIDRLEQERRDREASESLMREVREDLDRRIHDRKVADEIMNIPDLEWENTGDHYHHPYDGASSSSSNAGFSLLSGESFKVYCKGVESEEIIRDMRTTVGGIGVAICDSRENVIFQMSKRLDVEVLGVDEGQRGEGFVVPAEFEALVEGLSAALSLDLKNITFFCDDFMLYQYVTGRVQPMQGWIANLVDEVSLLQKQFIDCKPSLVERNQIKLAFKLARDAVVSQITWTFEADDGKKSLKETCVICLEDKDAGLMFSVDGCLHRFCISCMKQHVEVKLLNSMDAKCPREGCESKVSIQTCGMFMDPRLIDIMTQREKEASIAHTEKVYCPFRRCSALMSKNEVLEYTKTSFYDAENSGARKCRKCQYFFCINCRVPWHYNMTCYDYKRLNPYPKAEDAMFNNLAKQKKWRQCVKCSNMVELAEGCYHIICRCGYEFCYTCGAEWKNKKATCQCLIWDERNIIR